MGWTQTGAQRWWRSPLRGTGPSVYAKLVDQELGLRGTSQRLGRYELQRRIAVGGMAEVYLGRMVSPAHFEKRVVVKRILPQHALDPDVLRMFLDEARLMARLGHPNIPQVYDVAEAADVPYFAMEYVAGPDLRRVLSARPGQPLPITEAVAIGIGVAAGLHHAHEQRGSGGEPLGIVHRDVSPSNVLISLEGAVKVTDFGIAKWAQQRSLTHQGQLKGKLAHLSPEQCRGDAIDRRSDVFALGILLYEMTTGRLPFQAENEYNLLRSIINDPPPEPERTDGYPEELRQIVLRALAGDPAERYPNALALQSDLERFAHEAHLRLSPIAVAALIDERLGAQADEWRQLAASAGERSRRITSSFGTEPTGAPAERTLTDAAAETTRSAARAPQQPMTPPEVGAPSVNRRARRAAMTIAATVAVTITTAIAIAKFAPSERPRAREESGGAAARSSQNRAAAASASPDATAARHGGASSGDTSNAPEHRPDRTGTALDDTAVRPGKEKRTVAAPAHTAVARVAASRARLSASTARSTEPVEPAIKPALERSERGAAADQTTSSAPPSAGPAMKVWDPDSPVLPE